MSDEDTGSSSIRGLSPPTSPAPYPPPWQSLQPPQHAQHPYGQHVHGQPPVVPTSALHVPIAPAPTQQHPYQHPQQHQHLHPPPPHYAHHHHMHHQYSYHPPPPPHYHHPLPPPPHQNYQPHHPHHQAAPYGSVSTAVTPVHHHASMAPIQPPPPPPSSGGAPQMHHHHSSVSRHHVQSPPPTAASTPGRGPGGAIGAGGTPMSAGAHYQHNRPHVQVHNHDVLCGRGVHIAQHPGNERFRALVTTCFDESYCETYTMTEKRAVAESIIGHIKALDPPGRFLKRSGKSTNQRGMEGPWEELSQREAVKKTCQALRDCNRQDRTGYASAVAVPEDVKLIAALKSQAGLTNKQRAEAAAAAASKKTHEASGESQQLQKEDSHEDLQQQQRQPQNYMPAPPEMRSSTISPTFENAADWLKSQRRRSKNSPTQQGVVVATVTMDASGNTAPPPTATPYIPKATPNTAATTGCTTLPSVASMPHNPHHTNSLASSPSSPLPLSSHLQPPSPASQHLLHHHLSLPDSPQMPLGSAQAALFHHHHHDHLPRHHHHCNDHETPMAFAPRALGLNHSGAPFDSKPEATSSPYVSGGTHIHEQRQHSQQQHNHQHQHHHHGEQGGSPGATTYDNGVSSNSTDIDHLQLAAEAAAAFMGDDLGDDDDNGLSSGAAAAARFQPSSAANSLAGDHHIDDVVGDGVDYAPPSPTPFRAGGDSGGSSGSHSKPPSIKIEESRNSSPHNHQHIQQQQHDQQHHPSVPEGQQQQEMGGSYDV